MLDDVAEFHEKILKLEPQLTPTLVSQAWILERFKFLNEEANEFFEAGMSGDLVKAVDGLLDNIYVALGTLWQMGIPVEECWRAVHKANMTKVAGMTSRGNKVDAIKPHGWIGPEVEIAAAILDSIDGRIK